MKIKIDEIDLSLQTRLNTDAETVNAYAEQIGDGADFPPVVVFRDMATNKLWLADGFHRVMAARQLGRTVVNADVRDGSSDAAVLFGGTANNKQGKRPTRSDVQHFLEMVWERREAIFGGTPTGGNLAEKCGVSRQTAITFLNAHLSKLDTCQLPKRLVGADKKTYPVRPQMPVRAPVRPVSAVMPVRPSASVRVEPEAEEPETPGEVYDVNGVRITHELVPAFADGSPMDNYISLLRSAKRLLRGEIGDPSMAAMGQREEMLLNNALDAATFAKPYCICPACQGVGRDGCTYCKGLGFVNKRVYELFAQAK